MGWDGPILTDSGGFQVFSLRDTIVRLDDDGVTFRSVYDGSAGALHARAGRRDPGASGLRRRHVPRRRPPAGAPRRELEEAVRRTTLWAERQRQAPRAARTSRCSGSCRAASTRAAPPLDRGDRSPRLRRLRPRRPHRRRAAGAHARRRSSASRRRSPRSAPRYFMGIGDALGLLDVIERGIDLFDCVLPTRLGRTGSALTPEGRLNLKNARFTRDPRAARGGLRLPRLRTLLARVPPSPGQPAGAARPAPALAPQPALSHPADRGSASGDRKRAVSIPQGRDARSARRRKGARVEILIPIALLIALTYLVLVRPQRKRQQRPERDAVRAQSGRRDPHRGRRVRHGPLGR